MERATKVHTGLDPHNDPAGYFREPSNEASFDSAQGDTDP